MAIGQDFSIDENKDTVFAQRSFLSRHPVYYYHDDNNCFCGTTIAEVISKSGIEKEIDPEAVQLYLSFSCLPGNKTFFKGIKKLLPGSSLTFQSGSLQIQENHLKTDLEYQDIQTVASEIIECVSSKVRSQPCGFSMLSSGVDSSLLAALGKVHDTFTSEYDIPGFSECEAAANFAGSIGARHHRVLIDPMEYLEAARKMTEILEQPIGDPSVPAYYLLCRSIHEYTDICYSGEGIDEFFCGYTNYVDYQKMLDYEQLPSSLRRDIGEIAKQPDQNKGYQRLIDLLDYEQLPSSLRRAIGEIAKQPDQNKLPRILSRYDGFVLDGHEYKGNTCVFSEAEKKQLLKNYTGTDSLHTLLSQLYSGCEEVGILERMQIFDIRASFDASILFCSTRLAESIGLNVLMPYCSEELLRLGIQIPMCMKVRDDYTKYVFRLAAENVLPKKNAWQSKKGFPVPVRVWMKDPAFFSAMENALTGDTAQKIFNTDQCQQLLIAFQNAKEDKVIWRKIWVLYCLIIWFNSQI